MNKLFIFSIFIISIALAGCSQEPIPEKPTPTAAPPSSKSFAGETIIAEGRVLPVKSAALSFPTGGIISEIPVTPGAHVQAGQVLARLDTGQLELQLAQAEANLAASRAALDQLENTPTAQDVAAAEQNVAAAQGTLDKLNAGSSAADIAAAEAALKAAQQTYAQVRAGPTADQLAQLSAQLENAQAAMAQAQAAYDRIGGADNPQSAMTPQAHALQEATNNFRAAVAAYNEAKAHPTAAELAAAQSQVEQARAAIDRFAPDAAQLGVARAALENAKAQLANLQPSAQERAILTANVNAAQASRDLAAEQLKKAELVAPFAGTVSTLDMEAGEFAAPGAAILRLADTAAWQIETTDLTELNVVEVGEGTRVLMTFDAIPGLELPGKVSKVSEYGEIRQGDIVFTVIVTPDQPDPRLRWNMTAKVSIEGNRQ